MGVPIVSEANKGKELLLEIDSIVPDTKGHHLADVSLSSNDSLSHSRRRWKLIRIISKMNPNLQGKSKKLIFYQSLSVLLALILTGITIYWLVNLNSKANPFELPSSSSLLVSSRSSSSPSSSSSTPIQAKPSPSSPLPESPSKMTEDLPESFDYSVIQPLSINDNPVLRLMVTSNDTKDGATLKIADSSDTDETDDDEDYVKVTFWPPFSDEPEDWFANRFGPPPYLPLPFYPPAPQLSPPPPPHPSTFRKSPMGLDESPQPFSDIIDEPPMEAFNLAKFRSSAKSFHESAIGALDDIMRKLKDNKLIDFLVNGDENLDPDMGVPYDDTLEETGSTVGFVNFRQLDDDQGPVDNIFKFLKKTIF